MRHLTLAYPRQIIVGWMFLWRNGSATWSISPVSTITEVVPSPTSFVLRAAELDHLLGCRVRRRPPSNGVGVVRDDDAAHGV